MIKQAVILCGGLGTRLGYLTKATPKPLLPVSGEPFLETLVFELGRQGIRNVLLLAAFNAHQIREFASSSPAAARFRMSIDVAIEPEFAGTGGALWHALEHLAPEFFLLNGDTWFDIPLRALDLALASSDRSAGVLAVIHMDDTSRFGTVHLAPDGAVSAFTEKEPSVGSGYINGGVYALRREIVTLAGPSSSFEHEVLPAALEHGGLTALTFDSSFFIDIGLVETYNEAQTKVPIVKHRPAVFLDRDGVINIDHGYVGSVDRFTLIDGAGEAIARLNKEGYYVFVVTNQAGIGHGYFTIEDHLAVMVHLAHMLAEYGAHLDDHRFCPFHQDAVIETYKSDHPWRKPKSGMILDLMDNWPIDAQRSFLIGDKETDITAADNAQIESYLFQGNNLLQFIEEILNNRKKYQ